MAGQQKLKWVMSVFVAGGLGATSVALAAPGSGGNVGPRLAHAAHLNARSEAQVAARGGGSTVVRLQFSGTLQPGAVDGADATCPARAPHPISGYWGTNENKSRDGDLVPVRSTPVGGSGRNWETSVKNVSSNPITYYVGTVCLK